MQSDPGELSNREREIVALAAAGLSDSDISATLQISPRTVAAHMRNLRRKLGARNRTHAVARALISGVIGLPVVEVPVPQVTGKQIANRADMQESVFLPMFRGGPRG
ncbi:helix-turn-helix domain-containing protein [Amycolatopsis sp.]|uniref:helix-turn-helix domain-containing protein n=1 Tax=Amycolatopsis sp. TaxID=37632 RepID=UPI0039C860FE